jgi:hypothetical protein
MISLFPPSPLTKLPHRIKLHSGTEVFPDDSYFGRVSVLDEADAEELERKGWIRDAASRQAKAFANDLHRKAVACQMERASRDRDARLRP